MYLLYLREECKKQKIYNHKNFNIDEILYFLKNYEKMI
jgi:hypothetical protein